MSLVLEEQKWRRKGCNEVSEFIHKTFTIYKSRGQTDKRTAVMLFKRKYRKHEDRKMIISDAFWKMNLIFMCNGENVITEKKI